jgi:hypothetical protein
MHTVTCALVAGVGQRRSVEVATPPSTVRRGHRVRERRSGHAGAPGTPATSRSAGRPDASPPARFRRSRGAFRNTASIVLPFTLVVVSAHRSVVKTLPSRMTWDQPSAVRGWTGWRPVHVLAVYLKLEQRAECSEDTRRWGRRIETAQRSHTASAGAADAAGTNFAAYLPQRVSLTCVERG